MITDILTHLYLKNMILNVTGIIIIIVVIIIHYFLNSNV